MRVDRAEVVAIVLQTLTDYRKSLENSGKQKPRIDESHKMGSDDGPIRHSIRAVEQHFNCTFTTVRSSNYRRKRVHELVDVLIKGLHTIPQQT